MEHGVGHLQRQTVESPTEGIHRESEILVSRVKERGRAREHISKKDILVPKLLGKIGKAVQTVLQARLRQRTAAPSATEP